MLGKRVLVIEDDKDSLHAISELLRGAGFEVLTVDSRRDGLQLLQGETPPDYLVADGSMHSMLEVEAGQARRMCELLRRVSELLAQGTNVGAQLRDVARAIVPAYAAACVIERVDTAAGLREVMCTQHESSALETDLRAWACQPDWLAQLVSEVVDCGKARLLDLTEEAEVLAFHSDVASARALGFESVIVVPMVARRRMFGVLICAARATRRYTSSQVDTFVDLAHRLALALDNAELCSAAQLARRDQDGLLAALSNELQAPVAALANAAEAALGNAGAGLERSLAELFLQETRRIHGQLRELIEFTQLSSGQLQLRLQDVALQPQLRGCVEQARKADAKSRLTLEVDADVAELQVKADPERLSQALQLMLKAALAYMDDDGRLAVRVSRVDADLRLTLSGTGSRWTTQELVGLSELTSHDYVATGTNSTHATFGFRLARALVEMQGGRLWVDGAGSPALHLSLPLSAAHTRDNTEPPSPETVILLVDSDLAFRRELQEILSERGYNVETADNGLQAWQYLLGHSPPALILFDLVLPAMDGWELHAAIKSHAALQLVPTVIVSGLDRYRVEASLPDAHGYIEKPIRSAQLFEVVQRHVVSPARPRTMSVRPSSCF